MKTHKAKTYWPFLRDMSVHVLVLAIWEIACRTVIPPIYLPAPSSIVTAFIATAKSGELATQLGQTVSVLALGFFLALVTGMMLGVAMGASRVLSRLLDPYINALNAMPTVALVPLVVIWLGLGYEAKVFLTWIVSFFSIVISAQTAVQNIPHAYLDTARAFASGPFATLNKVVIPASIPYFVSGIRLGLARGLVGVVVAEMFTALSGLGYMVTTYGNTFRINYVFVPIITLAFLSVFLNALLRMAERRLTPWNRGRAR
ncbi:MAG: nitrate/sulfonate/bicarbonate transporter permease [Hyphomicrobiales bacterium]|nr:nitrate/sulfonate/bicarbonate transporter permease [Hyphomicrobiales bacterium]